MDARQRLGAVLVIAGVGLALIGVAGAAGLGSSPATAIASPNPIPDSTSVVSATEPAMTAVAPSLVPARVVPTPAPTADTLSLVTAFFAQLQAAVRAGAQDTLVDRLGQATIDRYGRDACIANLAAKGPVPEQAFEILAVGAPRPWDYVTDELTTTVPSAITVQARVTAPDATGTITTTEREVHVQLLDGIVYWFTDCGTPLG